MVMRITKNEWVSESAKFSLDNQGKVVRTYSHKRLVTSPDQGFDWDLAKALGYVAGQPHSSDTFAILRDLEIDRRPTRANPAGTPGGAENIWDLVLNYSTEATSSFNQSEDPTQARVKRSWQTTEQTLHIIRDRHNDPIVNAAGQPFDGGIPVTVELPTLVYERNESGFSGALATYYANSLNSDTYSGADPGTLKLKISATENNEGTFHWWAVKYEMAYYFLGWQPKPLNAGLMCLDGSGGLEDCIDTRLKPVSHPVPLNTDGTQTEITDLPGGANFITVDYFNTTPFGALGLDPV